MEKITLDDVLTQPVDALLHKIKQTEEASEIKQIVASELIEEEQLELPETLAAEEPISNTCVPDIQGVDLSPLKGFFVPGTIFTKNQEHNVGLYTVRILGLIPSANRVKFQVLETNTTHSMPVFALTGSSNDFPYKKGDQVMLDGQIYDVKRVNPANANVVLFKDNRYTYVKIGKITKV
jgi:hypothetical protein